MASERHERRRILLITRNFPPAVGGIQRYLMEIVNQLSSEFDIALCGPDGCSRFVGNAVRVSESRLTPLPFFLINSLAKSIVLGARFKPDLVLGGSGLMAPHALAVGRALGARVGVFVYGLDLVVESRVYQRLWLPAIRACDGVIPISRRTRALAIEKGVEPTRIRPIICPGTSSVVPDPDAARMFRAEHGLQARSILLSVGRLVPRKGLVEFVDRSLPAIVAAHPDVMLVVIGGEASDSLNGGKGDTGARAMAAAREHGVQANLLLLGQASDETLRGAWNAADVHVFPGREVPGDMEGFGIVCIEAAAYGVPTAAFDVGGVADAVAPNRSGALVVADDYAAMGEAVLNLLARASHSEAARSEAMRFAAEFSWDAIGERIRDVAAELVARH